MKLLKGLFTDTQPLDNPPSTWIDGKNMLMSKKYQGIANEWGFLKLSITYYDVNKYPIGVIPVLGTSKFLVFSFITDNDGLAIYSEIGVIDADNNFSYTAVIDSIKDSTNSLNFVPDRQVSGEACLNNEGEIVCAFTDNYNKPRVINCSDDFSVFDEKQILMFPESIQSDLDISIVDGGVLPAGAIFITSKYMYNDGSFTNNGTISEASYIIEDSSSNSYNYIFGSPTGVLTNKALKLQYTNLDTVYSSIVISAIIVEAGIVKAYEVGIVPITSTNLTYIVTGENLEPIELLELTSKIEAYKTIKSITTINKQLLLANSKKRSEFKFQKYANLIELEVKSTLLTVDTTATSSKVKEFNSDKATLMHDEVYAIYIAPVFKDNTLGYLYHIAGRAVEPISASSGNNAHILDENTEISTLITAPNIATYTDLKLDASTDSDDSAIGTNPKYFQTRCTAIVTTGTQCKPAFWENEDEVYPNNDEYDSTLDYDGTTSLSTVDLRGQKVRHHRMPDISWLRDNFYSADDEYGYNKLDTLSLIVKNLKIPTIYKEEIQGFKFFFAKKTPENSLILCNDITHYMGSDVTISNKDSLLNTGGNFDIQDYVNGIVIQLPINSSDYIERVKCHAADLLINKPSIQATHIKQLLKIYYYYNTIITQKSNDSNVGLVNYFLQGTIIDNAISNNYRNKKITNVQYVPNNTVVYVEGKKVDNTYGEEFLHFIVNNSVTKNYHNVIWKPLNDFLVGRQYNDSNQGILLQKTGAILYSLCQYKENVHLGFDTQTDFISFPKYYSINYLENNGSNVSGAYTIYDNFDLYGGDSVLSDNCYLAYGLRFLNDVASADVAKGIKLLHRYLAPTRTNLSLRNLDALNGAYSNFYPKILTFDWLTDLERQYNPVIGYNIDFSKRNNLDVVECFNISNKYFQSQPDRIIKGTKRDNLQQFETWKEFLANDFYEFVTNFGQIENIQGLSNGELLIQTTNALHKTRSITRIGTDANDAILGTGDLFEFPPQEVQPDNKGSIGTIHQQACKLIPQGYVSIDSKLGKLTIVGESKKEISSEGLHNFFRDYGGTNKIKDLSYTDDCPITFNGYNIEYDSYFNRLLVSKKDFTIKEIYLGGLYASTNDFPIVDDWVEYNNDPNLRFVIARNFGSYLYQLQVNDITTGITTISYVDPQDSTFFDDNSFTLSYSFDYGCWAFFHDYTPNYLFRLRNNILLSVARPIYSTPVLNDYTNKFYQHNNNLCKAIYYNHDIVDGIQMGTPYKSYIIPVFNDINTFLTQSILWISYVQENDKNIMKNESFDLILLWNTNQCSGDTNLVVYTNINDWYGSNLRKVKENWIFSQFKNLVDDEQLEFIQGGNGTEITTISGNISSIKEIQFKNRFCDKWLAIKLVYNNTKAEDSLTQNNILLTEIDIVKQQLRR